MKDEELLDFNFWPSFADLMLSLVLILIVVMFLVIAAIRVGTVNLSDVEKSQTTIIKTVASAYQAEPQPISKNTFGISLGASATPDVIIQNKTTLQQITFSDHVLFNPDEVDLKPEGKQMLRIVGTALRQELSSIREIQVQGHADTDHSRKFQTNTELAATRAIQVFHFLQNDVGIDPAEHLMSATSFGEFKSVAREEQGASASYGWAKVVQDNGTPELKAKNRRIELLLFYRE